MNAATPATPPDALLCAAFDALHRGGRLAEPTLEEALRDPVHAGVLRAYAAALRHGQRPFPPPVHVRPSVIAPPAPLQHERTRTQVPRRPPAHVIDMKRRAAGDTD
jgi:hypothetical protein